MLELCGDLVSQLPQAHQVSKETIWTWAMKYLVDAISFYFCYTYTLKCVFYEPFVEKKVRKHRRGIGMNVLKGLEDVPGHLERS